MSKTLVIIITYNPYNKPNFEMWKKVFEQWAIQRNENQQVDILMCDCISHENQRTKLLKIKDKFQLNILFVNKRFNEHQCVNLALSLVPHDYDYYMINTCDAYLKFNIDLQFMIEDMNHQEDTALIVPTVIHDFETGEKHTPMISRVWNTNIQMIHDTNKIPSQWEIPYWPRAHMMLLDKYYMEKFNYKVMDLTGAAYTQILTTTLLASIKRKGAICHRVQIVHKGQMEIDDLSNYNFPVPDWHKDITWQQLRQNPDIYKSKLWEKFYKLVREGIPLGMNYGHYLGGGCDLIEPDPNVFDDQGYPKLANELYEYLKKNFFLQKEQFDHRLQMPYEWIPHERS